jgi:hypothetical protein
MTVAFAELALWQHRRWKRRGTADVPAAARQIPAGPEIT